MKLSGCDKQSTKGLAEKFVANGKALYCSRSDVERGPITDLGGLVAAVQKAYVSHSNRDAVLPKSEYLKFPGRSPYDRIIPLLGCIGGETNLAGLKVICSSTQNAIRGLPRASGLILLHDIATARCYAIIEASLISATRTAVVTTIALKYLSPKRVNVLAVIGAGALAHAHLVLLDQFYGSNKPKLAVFDIDRTAAEKFAQKGREKGFETEVTESGELAVRAADVVIPMTTASYPWIEGSWLKRDSLYCAVSLLDAHLSVFEQASAIVVDDFHHCAQEGRPIQRLFEVGRLKESDVIEVGQILSGRRDPPSPSGRFVFNPMGTIITDLAVANLIFEHSLAHGLGTLLDI